MKLTNLIDQCPIAVDLLRTYNVVKLLETNLHNEEALKVAIKI